MTRRNGQNKQTHVTVPLSKISCYVWKVETTSMFFLHCSKARQEAVQIVQAALEICTVEIRIRYGYQEPLKHAQRVPNVACAMKQVCKAQRSICRIKKQQLKACNA